MKRLPTDKITLAECQALIYSAFENAPNDEEFARRIWATISRLAVAEQEKAKAERKARPWWRL